MTSSTTMSSRLVSLPSCHRPSAGARVNAVKKSAVFARELLAHPGVKLTREGRACIVVQREENLNEVDGRPLRGLLGNNAERRSIEAGAVSPGNPASHAPDQHAREPLRSPGTPQDGSPTDRSLVQIGMLRARPPGEPGFRPASRSRTEPDIVESPHHS